MSVKSTVVRTRSASGSSQPNARACSKKVRASSTTAFQSPRKDRCGPPGNRTNRAPGICSVIHSAPAIGRWSSARWSTSVGTAIEGRMSRTSIAWFICSICRYAFGLPLSLWARANASNSGSEAVGNHSRTSSVVPQPSTSCSRSRSHSAFGRPQGKSGAQRNRGNEPYTHSAATRSGCNAANNRLMGPPSETPITAARDEPAASMIARTSSIRVSRSATPTGSDAPVPRLSNRINRHHSAMAPKYRARAGSSQIRSTCDIAPGTYTRSNGPSPTT